MNKTPSLPLVYGRLVLTALCWGAMFHAGRYVVGFMSPLAAAAWRFALAAAIFLPLIAWIEGWSWRAIQRNAWVLGIMSAVGVFGFNTGLFFGLKATSAVNGALIVAVSPALTTVLAALINRRWPSFLQVLGLVLGMSGVAVVVSGGSLHALLGLHLSAGDALVFMAALCWSVYSVLPQRFVKGVSPLQIAGSTIIGGAVLMIGFALATAPDFLAVPPVGGSLAIAFMAIFGSVLAYMWWNSGVEVVGPAQASIFMNFVPLFAALIGVLKGDHLVAAQWIGAVLIIAGVLASTVLHNSLALHARPVPSGKAC
ncbi:MAG TPA: DMT family transporter [Aquabacterium sp.]|nr:DMT family transporter [Aquabacterium sp.]